VKHANLRNRLAALEAILRTEPVRIRVVGGLAPPSAEPAKPEPGGRELAEQAALFARRPRQALGKPAGAPPGADPKNAPAGSVGAPAPKLEQGLAPVPRRAAYRSRRRLP
jgi:hypothetical protein